MRLKLALCLGFFFLLLCFFLSLEFYKGPFPQNAQVETWRKAVDVQLRAASLRESTLWINRFIFHNQDKYVWYPPRIIPQYNKDGTTYGFVVYGMVTSWNPQEKLITLSSYASGPLFVRFIPAPKGPIAIMNRFDQFGQVQAGEIQLVLDSDIPNWDTLFCTYDIVSVEAKSADAFNRASEKTPLAPTVITLFNRLCKQ